MILSRFIILFLMLLNVTDVFGQLTEPNNKHKYKEQEAKNEIDKIYQRIIGGEEIEDIAQEVSQDPGTFLRGGVIGMVNPSAVYVDDFVLAIEDLKINEVSKPFRTDFGYHIAKVLLKKKDKMLIQHILIIVRD